MSAETMNALAWFGNKDIRLVHVNKPTIKSPTDAIVKITKSALSSSDLKSDTEMKPYDIIGHEAIGIIDEVGDQVKLQKGQRVVISFTTACGDCSYCDKGQFNSCVTVNPLNQYEHKEHKYHPGCLADFVLVPFADVDLLPIPEEISDDSALLLSDALSTSYHATQLANVQKGDIVGIWGLGPIGLLTAKWCFLKGAKRVIGVDMVDCRLKMALKMGIETIDYNKESVNDFISRICPKGLDCAINCAGLKREKALDKVSQALHITNTSNPVFEAIRGLRRFGRFATLEESHDSISFPMGEFMDKHLSMTGGTCPIQGISYSFRSLEEMFGIFKIWRNGSFFYFHAHC
eukprot:NODE_28_length_38599_cov_0.791792.p11 type:complete len:347 gc:universal NODE_28_length_38599_cov_0.791792:620-1660(+)